MLKDELIKGDFMTHGDKSKGTFGNQLNTQHIFWLQFQWLEAYGEFKAGSGLHLNLFAPSLLHRDSIFQEGPFQR